MTDWIGYRWLAGACTIDAVQRFRIESAISSRRTTRIADGYRTELYPPSYRPADTAADHLAFALRYEGIHLEFLHRLFQKLDRTELEAWIAHEPTGQYARRACFLYEWLTGIRIEFAGVTSGNYVDAIDHDRYVSAVAPTRNQRWRVNDNLPGIPAYCPTVLRTPSVKAAETYDAAAKLLELETEFGADLLRRSAVWLTVKESRASFAIEHEEREVNRVQRFAAAIETLTGVFENPLATSALSELQRQILGERATRYGVRRSPVFVGERVGVGQVVHYIAPHWDDAPGLLEGLRRFEQLTRGRSPLMRAAVMSFGFVYVHPMADGNGRISRFLVNDTLRRDGAIPPPFILPVSATIIGSIANRLDYDRVLAVFSKPLMQRYQGAYRFAVPQTAADEVLHDIEFDAYPDALSAWRYPDFTDHVEYLSGIVRNTIEVEMRKEAAFLRSHRRARDAVKEIIEGPDADIDRIIRSVTSNNWTVSGKLAAAFPALAEPAIAGAAVVAVRNAFAPADGLPTRKTS